MIGFRVCPLEVAFYYYLDLYCQVSGSYLFYDLETWIKLRENKSETINAFELVEMI